MIMDSNKVMRKYEQEEQAKRMNPWGDHQAGADNWASAIDELNREFTKDYSALENARSVEAKW